MSKKRNSEEIEATVGELPVQPPLHTVELLQKRGMLKKERLVYSCTFHPDALTGKKRKMVKVYCTACGGEDYLEHVSFESGCSRGASLHTFGFIDPFDHNAKVEGQPCVCPCCGIDLSALHASHIRNAYEMDRAFCVSVHNVRGHLCLLSWTIGKYVNKSREIVYTRNMWEGSLIVDGSFVSVKGYQKYMSSVYYCSHWQMRSKGIDYIGSCVRSEILDFTKGDIESTSSPYCALYEYVRSCSGQDRFPGAYLQLWCKYPHVENLIRQGYTKYLNHVLSACMMYPGAYYSAKIFKISATSDFINWKSKKPLDMLGFEKSEAHLIKIFKYDTLDFYKLVRDKYGIRLSEDILNFIESCCGVYSAKRLLENDCIFHRYKIPLVRVFNYLNKQLHILSEAEARRISPFLLIDYWEYVYREYRSMRRSELYPKNLVRAHDTFVQKVKEKEELELVAVFEQRFQELSLFSYESPSLGLLIRPCRTQKEMIEEGKKLCHCVGSYRKEHAKGSTSIFFIRRIEAPDDPFYTLELRNNKICQDHGYKNQLQTDEIKAFEEEWLSFISNIIIEKGKQDGKSSTGSALRRAGA